ncbi:Nucleoside phosphorylase [Penicillium occitanis (nom. inval.)]|nr:hypothetical protein PENOC_073410 [Penicillium occitanis (nom. inval.)]PCH04489.1 Nucleoside phosphorylase [Penicillium occitanis (nom. inval.)]
MSRTSRPDGVQDEIILQEEEVQIVPVPEVAQSTISSNPFDHNIESGSSDLEVQDEDPEFIEEDFNIDLVDQLARDYLESLTLALYLATIGWICALPLEMAAAKAALDELHPRLPASPSDHNIYTLGAIHGHNVAIACLPFGVYGIRSAAIVAANITSTFPNFRYSLMVRIAGGIIQCDYGKTLANGIFQRTGCLNKPPAELLSALVTLESKHFLGKPSGFGSDASAIPGFASPGSRYDFLFDPLYPHVGVSSEECHLK